MSQPAPQLSTLPGSQVVSQSEAWHGIKIKEINNNGFNQRLHVEEQLQPERDRGVRESEDLRSFSSLSHIMSGGAARRCGGSGEEGVFQPLLRDTLTRTWSRRDTRKNTGGVFMRAVSPEATVKVHCSGLADSRAAGQRIFTVYLPNSQLILFAEFGILIGGV